MPVLSRAMKHGPIITVLKQSMKVQSGRPHYHLCKRRFVAKLHSVCDEKCEFVFVITKIYLSLEPNEIHRLKRRIQRE